MAEITIVMLDSINEEEKAQFRAMDTAALRIEWLKYYNCWVIAHDCGVTGERHCKARANDQQCMCDCDAQLYASVLCFLQELLKARGIDALENGELIAARP